MIRNGNLAAQQFQDNLHSMLTWFLSPKSKGLELVDGPHCARMLSENITLGYQNMPVNDSERRIKSLTIPDIVEQEYLLKDKVYLRPIIELKRFAAKKLKRYLDAFLILGSMATMDYSRGWSDLDTYLFINKDTIFDPGRLMELRERLLNAYSYLLRIDPLQHHGFLVCTAFDLQQYSSYYMPVNVLEYAKSLLGECNLKFAVLPSSVGTKERFRKHLTFFKETYQAGILKHHAYNGEYLLDNFRNRNNSMYQMKYFLGFVSLLPAYYLEANGTPCYKRDSFEAVKPLVSADGWELVEKASLVRKEWANREKHPYENNRIPSWIVDMLGDNYFKRMYGLVSSLWGCLINRKGAKYIIAQGNL